ncbi:sugar ABC transporter ATP-binding protein [Nitriliruptoraceae bacterium ZYF776]|nr:sugar ABC transporter ATP-binding protein [Profundirhabdus halotolerans]
MGLVRCPQRRSTGLRSRGGDAARHPAAYRVRDQRGPVLPRARARGARLAGDRGRLLIHGGRVPPRPEGTRPPPDLPTPAPARAEATTVTTAPLLTARGISKAYPGVQALAHVDLDVQTGEVHALLGENGAGKSTLMKVIAGSIAPDDGEVHLDGDLLPLGDPVVLRRRGIGVVHQELSLVESMSVVDNVMLGQWPRRAGLVVDRAAARAEARRRLDRIGVDVALDTRVGTLGVATRQLIELAKAIDESTRILLLDEPTSALSDPEARRLFQVIAELRESGVGMVYVSHRLPEIMEICDRVTVLRNGHGVETRRIADVDEAELARLMVGRDIGLDEVGSFAAPTPRAAPALVARGFGRPPRLAPVDLEVAEGEIVAVFGLVGAGRTRLANALFGLEPATTGHLEVFGEPTELRTPSDAIDAGFGYLGESRHEGIVPAMSLTENITLASLDPFSRYGVIRGGDERRTGRRYVEELRMRVSGPEQRIDTLSGGNQQKGILARSLCSEARILILDDPTRGVDIGAKEEIFRLVRDLASQGAAVLYLTSEIREARALAHRMLVMSKGRVVTQLPVTAPDDQVMAAAGGVHV